MLGWQDNTPLKEVLPAKEATAITKALDVRTVGELLLHIPRAYSRHGSGVNVEDAQDGDVVTCVGEVIWAQSSYTSTGKLVHKIVISDGHNTIAASFFQQKLPQRQLREGVHAMFSGKLKFFRDTPQISHPSYIVIPREVAAGDGGPEALKKAKLRANGNLKNLANYGSIEALEQLLSELDYLPVYPARKGVTSWRLLGAVDATLKQLPTQPEPLDQVPDGMISFDEMLRQIHQPNQDGPRAAIARFKFNEALSLALVMALRAADAHQRPSQPLPPTANGRVTQLIDHLPYQLTRGQQQVIREISEDLSGTHPMNRLLQGEVGSGKTVVSLVAMLQAVDAGAQAAFMAPTEVLAVQHARSTTAALEDAGIDLKVVTLTGSLPVPEKRQALLDIVSGEAHIVIGTHALIQDSVNFFNLGLVVVDEQHRFGVEQRDHLRSQGPDGLAPHLLVMTATPIPRTIAMTTFGDLSESRLSELPGGRRPISTAVVPGNRPTWVARAWERIREEVGAGRQAFVVCPRISGEGGVEEVYEQLAYEIFPDLKVTMVHGKMHPADKDEQMSAFARGEIDIMVATTVIEVGIDVPNATVMYVREAENFGVSQLHQLRGRVGRGNHASLCLLHTDSPEDSPAFQRLSRIAATTDGFELAELDLLDRQEGDVLGTDQSGSHKRVRLLSLVEDGAIIEHASNYARELVVRNRALAEQLVSDVALDSREFIEKA